MELNGFSLFFLDDLMKMGFSFYIDDDDIDDDEKSIRILCDENPDVVIELDPLLEHLNIYRTFEYYGLTKTDIEEGNAEEELAQDTGILFSERLFTSYISNRSFNLVTTWEDNYAYLCSCAGYTTYVGYYKVPCTHNIISDFMGITKDYDQLFGLCDTEELREHLFEQVLRKFGFEKNMKPNWLFKVGEDIAPSYSISQPVSNYYIGKEYAYFKNKDQKVEVDIKALNLCLEVFEMCEYTHNITYYISNSRVIAKSENYLALIDAKLNISSSSKIEEMYLKNQISLFAPFASNEFSALVDSTNSILKPLIFTEGYTDWMHLKNGLNRLKEKGYFKYTEIDFFEYGPELSMGNQALLNMCNSNSKQNNSKAQIFVFDRDDKSILKEISQDGKYKDWGNKVYSLALPVPVHRISTPEICMEHYYSDEEIKREFQCDDGISRRLYIGNEFDPLGRAPNIGKLCAKRSLCGESSVRIIDDAVLDLNSTNICNYALSKAKYAENINNICLSEISINSFISVFNVIQEVLEKSKSKN